MSSEGRALILYVDDEWTNRVVFEQSFNQRFDVQAVGSGAEALDVLANRPVAVLVTDQRMPGMLGTELLTRAKSSFPDTVRMIITAYSDIDPILRAVNEGLVVRYIVKPWDRVELEGILAWGVEAYAAGLEGSEIQARLIHTERLAMMGMIASAVLHDVAQPLVMMHYTTQRLRELAGEGGAALARELPELVTELESGLSSALEISGSMRALFEPAPPLSAERAVDPAQVIRQAVSLARRLVAEGRIRLGYDGPDELDRIAIGRTELMQILINLITNAAQAIQRREAPIGRITVTAAARVTPAGHACVSICVADDGPGMEAELLAKVGRPFHSRRVGGVGLGLSQCMRLVGSAGGTVDISSRAEPDGAEPTGTMVTFTIPAFIAAS